MAMEIKSPPVLRGKAAKEFYERWANFKDDTSKEEVLESMRRTKSILSKYYNPYKTIQTNDD